MTVCGAGAVHLGQPPLQPPLQQLLALPQPSQAARSVNASALALVATAFRPRGEVRRGSHWESIKRARIPEVDALCFLNFGTQSSYESVCFLFCFSLAHPFGSATILATVLFFCTHLSGSAMLSLLLCNFCFWRSEERQERVHERER